MRKSSKLLAVLLTLCLLFGAITAIFVSAEGSEATTPTLAQQATTDQLKVGDKLGYVSVSNSTVSSTANRTLSGDNLIDILPTETSDGYEYVTIDMDFYLDLSAMTTTTNKYFQIMVLSAINDEGTNKGFPSAGAYLAYNSTEKAYFLSFDSSGAEAKPEAKVSDVVGVYDHLTYVLKFEATTVDGTPATAITTSIYLNGTFIDKSEPQTTTTSKLQISRPATKSSAWDGRKIGVDNLAINYFEADSDNTGALETALTGNAPLYNATSGVLYTAAYPTPDKTVVELKGEQLTLPAALKEFANMSTGDTVTVWGGRKLAYAPIPAGVKSFNVTCNDGSTFNVPGFEANEDGTVYTVVRENDYSKGDASYSSGTFNSKLNGNVNKTITSTGNNYYEAKHDFSKFKYATVDFDFAFTSDDFYTMGLYTSISRTSGKEDGDSYTTGTDYTAVSTRTISKVGDDYYMGTVKLSNEKNVYDHFTVLFAFETVGGTFTVRSYMYVNGELAFSDSQDYEDTHTQHQVARLQIRNASEATATVKNIYVNLYEDSDSENGIASIVGTDKPLYMANDVVYNEDFLTGNENKYATVGDDSYKYYVIGGAFNNVPEGGTVYLNGVVGEYTLPKNFFNITVVDETGTFSPSAADQAMYNITDDGHEYTYELKNYAEVDGKPYADIDEAFLALEEGGTITIVGTVENYTLPKILESFTVEAENFSLCEEQAALYAVDGNTYTIKAYAMIGDETYYNIDEAFLALKDGETVTIVGTVENYTLPADMTAHNFTVELNNENTDAFSLSEESAANYDVADGAYEYNKYAETADGTRYYDDDYVDAFAELGHDGDDIILSNIAVENFVAKAADYNTFSVILKNGATFTLDYSKSDAYCATVVDEETTTYTNVFVREQLMASVSLFSSEVNFKLYLPEVAGLTYVEADGMSVTLSGNIVTWTPPVWHYASERIATVTGTYVNGETEGTVTIASKLSITGYALKVIENTTQNPCGGEAQQVVRAMIEYKLAVATYKPAQASGSFTQSKKDSNIDSLTTFLAKYNTKHSDCQCGTVVAEGTHIKVGTVAETKPENLLSNVSGVTFGFAGTNQGYYLILTGVESETAPTISYIGHKGNSRTPITASLEAMTTEGNYKYEFAASDLDNEFTVTIDGVEYVYSLAYYLDAANTALADAEAKVAEGDESAAEDVTTWTEAIAQANALAKYALAAENFKVSPVTEQ